MEKAVYFFLLSGEYDTLPAAELRSVLKILDPNHQLIETRFPRVLAAETGEEIAREAVERAAYVKLCGKLIAEARSDEKSILNVIDESFLAEILSDEDSTFAVRGKRIGGAKIDRLRIEREMGARILELNPRLKVDLVNPDVVVFSLITPLTTFIGKLIHSKPKHFFEERVAGRRPFALPSAMQPDFSRAMINLAEVKIGGRILDPFAGTGGIMIEGGLLGYQVYGVEFKKWIAEGALRNLKHYLRGGGFMIIGDARNLMFRDELFDAIVTDPPYGRSTTVPDRSVLSLLESFFDECLPLLRRGRRMVMASPADIDLERLASDHGLNVAETHLARVHGSLVRKVVVLEK